MIITEEELQKAANKENANMRRVKKAVDKIKVSKLAARREIERIMDNKKLKSQYGTLEL